MGRNYDLSPGWTSFAPGRRREAVPAGLCLVCGTRDQDDD